MGGWRCWFAGGALERFHRQRVGSTGGELERNYERTLAMVVRDTKGAIWIATPPSGGSRCRSAMRLCFIHSGSGTPVGN